MINTVENRIVINIVALLCFLVFVSFISTVHCSQENGGYEYTTVTPPYTPITPPITSFISPVPNPSCSTNYSTINFNSTEFGPSTITIPGGPRPGFGPQVSGGRSKLQEALQSIEQMNKENQEYMDKMRRDSQEREEFNKRHPSPSIDRPDPFAPSSVDQSLANLRASLNSISPQNPETLSSEQQNKIKENIEKAMQETIKNLEEQIKKLTEENNRKQNEIDNSVSDLNPTMENNNNKLDSLISSFQGIEEKEKLIDLNTNESRVVPGINEEFSKLVSSDASDLLEKDGIIPPREPYKINFQSQGVPRQQLENIYQNLNQARPFTIQGKQAKVMGYVAVEEADKSFAEGDTSSGAVFKEYAQIFADVAMDAFSVINPVTAHATMARDVLEASTGRKLLSGERLSVTDRAILITSAVVGITFSAASSGMLGGTAASLTKNGLKYFVRFGDNLLAKGIDIGKDTFKESVLWGDKIIASAAKLGLKAKEELTEFTTTFKKIVGNSRGSGDLHTPVVEFFESIAGTTGKEGYDLVKGIPGLKYTGEGTWVSEAGIIYGQGTKENRLRHVLQHRKPDPSKPLHTVFGVETKEIPQLIDQAWLKKGNAADGDPGAFIVEMGKVIGTQGESKIKIVVETNTSKIVTAYPIK
ncbi:MAG: hypothetical protein HQK52_16555 [Oligoflexia bacterium]|nr:hypothetical protein [Oligoflexia bacterium]